ncbi:T9SS type A sorting domain-containing protein [Psychroserpens sp. MEBiC05023]
MKKITFILLFALVCSFSFAQTFTDSGGPYDIQNGEGGTGATCGTAFELSLPLTVSGIGTLGTTNILQSVTLNITHSWNDDIVISLQDPSGTVTVLLTDDNGGNGDGFVDVILQDGSPELPDGNTDPITGTFAPDEPLSTFNAASISADGDWVLLVCDDAGGDTGQIENWSLTFAPAPSCADPEAFTAVSNSGTTADLAWTQVGSVSLWDIELVDITATGTATGTPTSTGVSNPTTLTGLTPENDYEVYVRADCGMTDGVSNWVGPVAFTTPPLCNIVTTVPIDALTDISIDFSWDAPATGTPVGYNWEIVEDGTGQGGTVLASGSTTEPTRSASSGDVLTLDTDYDIWIQTDCGADGTSVWNGPFEFLTQPGPAPANNDCAGAQSVTQETSIVDAASATAIPGSIVGATPSGLDAEVCNGFTGTANDDVWYSFEALTANVNITFEFTNFDGVAQLYSGSCGSLAVVDCSDSTFGTGPQEEINATGLTVGETYYTRIYQYNTSNTAGKVFNVKVWSPDVLSVESLDNENAFRYFPNPVNNELTLSAQKDIQNVAIFNMLGQEVLRTAPNTVESTIDMNGLSQGAYFVKVTIDNTTDTIRIIKQ